VELLVSLCHFVAESVCLVDEDEIELGCPFFDDMIELSQGLHLVTADTEFEEGLLPVILQHRRADNQNFAPELLGEHGGYVSLAEADHVGEKDAVVSVEDLLRGNDRLLLVVQVHEAFREIRFKILVDVDVLPEVLIKELQVEVVGSDLVVEPSLVVDGIHVLMGEIDRVLPELLESGQGEFHVRPVFQLHVELPVGDEPRLGEVAGTGDHPAEIAVVLAESADINLGVKVAAGVGLDLHLTGAQELDELADTQFGLVAVRGTVHLFGNCRGEDFFCSFVGFEIQCRLSLEGVDDLEGLTIDIQADEDADLVDRGPELCNK